MPTLAGLTFVSDGELAVRLAGIDTTGWTPAFRSAVVMCLASPAPTFLWYGDARSLIYNDAAIPLLGDAHPTALTCSELSTVDVRWRAIGERVASVSASKKRTTVDGLTLTPLLDEAGAVLAIIGTALPVSEVATASDDDREPRERASILLVHADSEVLRSWRTMLDPRWDVTTACNAADAIACAASNAPDLIIVDDTAETATVHRLREAPGARRIPLIFVTSTIVDVGADDYVLEPVSPRELKNRVRLQLALARRREDEARKAVRDRDDFLLMIGHELRNPLSALSTMVQALLLRGPSNELQLLERSALRLTRLVDDLLECSRLSRGEVQLQTKVVELAHLVDRALERVTPQIAGARNPIQVSVPRIGCRLRADPDRLVRVLVNVLTNAIQATPAGGRIAIDATSDAGGLRLTIRDEGSGISPEQLSHVFEAFHSARTSGGLGLGLSIARQLVELHGGTIALTSEGPGTGTLCTIELPSTSQPTLDELTSPPRAARYKLLIIEDNHDTAISLKSALEQVGYEVALAHDAPIALNLARTFHPDIALVDIGLPVMDGWELAKRLRDGMAQMPIVAVTARDQESDKQKSADLGFAEHLVKPIDLPTLQRLVSALTSSRRAES